MDLSPALAIHDGAGIGIFSPSDRLAMNYPALVKAGSKILEQHGFKSIFAHNYLAQDGIRAGTVAQRLNDINELLDALNVNALLASWGGKACNHLVYDLSYEKFLQKRKP
jgi:muramoyltetrapeptide carboxypeptidase LdcA involved in peptidoglycan recycling